MHEWVESGRRNRAVLVFALVIIAGVALVGLYSAVYPSSSSSSNGQSCGNPTAGSQSSPSQSGLQIMVGGPLTTTFNPEFINTTVGPMLSFIGWEELSVYVHSNVTADVSLGLSDVPCGVWAEFDPSSLQDVGPAGARTSLLLAGAVSLLPQTSNPGNVSLIIGARTGNGTSSAIALPVVQQANLTVLHSPGLVIEPGAQTPWGAYTKGNTSDVFGVVYDPANPQRDPTLSVSLSAAGWIQNGSLVPLPSWMRVNLPTPSFILNASDPYYFQVGIATQPAHFGNYTISLREEVNGQPFTGSVTIETHNPPPFG
jgi:hypothetical protein